MHTFTIDPNLLAMLVCPLTRTPLEYHSAQQVLISREAKLVYHIRAGIPVMLPTEATPLEQWLAQQASASSAD